MAFAESSLSKVFIGTSTTKDVEPSGTGAYQEMELASHSMAPTSGSFEDPTITTTGEAIDQFRIDKAGNGDISGPWRPVQWDGCVSSIMRSPFGSAISLTPTVDFSAPSALGLQTITDNGANGLVTVLKGDAILIAGAVAAGNNGLKMVVVRDTPGDVITIYNPGGASATADAISITHQGVVALGSSTTYLWAEREQTDGTEMFFTEWFKNGKAISWALDFPAKAPTTCVFNIQADSPLFRRKAGGAAITMQRRTNGTVGTDAAPTGVRLVHGMEDVREIVLYDSVGAIVKRFDDRTAASFGFTVGRTPRSDSVVGTSGIVNTGISPPKIDGRLNAFLDDDSSYLAELWDDYPDELQLHCIFGATDATCYGVWLDQVRMQGVPDPVGGNNAAVTINSTFSAKRMRVTRF